MVACATSGILSPLLIEPLSQFIGRQPLGAEVLFVVRLFGAGPRISLRILGRLATSHGDKVRINCC